jgi:hypothetical protein
VTIPCSSFVTEAIMMDIGGSPVVSITVKFGPKSQNICLKMSKELKIKKKEIKIRI